MEEDSKHYFTDIVAKVQAKLNCLPNDSIIRQYFPDSRLDRISRKIADTICKNLEWASWQPLFLFLHESSSDRITSLEDDLRLLKAHTRQGEAKVCEFLADENESTNPWAAGLFEVFAKAAMLKSDLVTVDSLDWRLLNGRDVDARVKVGERAICLEFTTLGESDAAKVRWQDHLEMAKESHNRVFFEGQDAYSPGRRLYGKVYDKIAPEFKLGKSQLSLDSPNLLLIGFFPLITDMTPSSPSIGWALDELFASQPTGDKSPISLEAFLRCQPNNSTDVLEELLAAPSKISGILLFQGCKLGEARINYNATKEFRLSHAEMALFEKLFSQLPLYCR